MRSLFSMEKKLQKFVSRAYLDSNYNIDKKTRYLHGTVYVAKPGVLIYRRVMPDGSIKRVRVLVTEQVLHDAAVRASLNSKSVINEHRYDESGEGVKMTAQNTQGEASGWTHNDHVVAPDGKHTQIGVTIMDQKLISLIQAGKHQVSPGYDAYTDETPGEHPEYGPYDEQQVHRDYNHICFTWKGRGGRSVAFRMDSDTEQIEQYTLDAWEIDPADGENLTEDPSVDKDKEKDQKPKEGFNVDADRIVKLSNQVSDLTSENKELQGENKTLKAELEKAQSFNTDSAIEQASIERSELIDEAMSLMGSESKRSDFKGLNQTQIKALVVKSRFDSLEFDENNAHEVNGAYKTIQAKPKHNKTETGRTEGGNKVKAFYDAADSSAPKVDPMQEAYNKQLAQMSNQGAE